MDSDSSSSSSLPQTPDDSASPSLPRDWVEPELPRLEKLQLYLRIHKERMFEQGLLDDFFMRLEMLEVAGNPGIVASIIQAFYRDAEEIFMSSENLLNEEITNFPLLLTHIYRLEEASGSIGCPTIESSCIKFKEFCELQDKQGCVEALREVKYEFYRMKENINYILELNEKIVKEEEEDNDSGSE